MLSIVTINVNGVRASLRNGGLEWLLAEHKKKRADIICMQEVRANDEQLAESLAAAGMSDWNVVHSASTKKGHAGVAIISKLPFVKTKIGLGPKQFAEQGRWVEATFDTAVGPLKVASIYVHTGDQEIPERQAEKEAFLAAMTTYMRKEIAASGEESHALLVGDLNVGHTERDIKNWKGNIGNAGFLESERAYFDTWMFKQGWVDLGREHAGDVQGPYTWWSMRGQAFDNDAGWRIDYMLATPGLAEHLKDISIGRAASWGERWSDHAPVTARFTIGD
jgi:exodeoxyribonuclease-3